MSTPVEQVEVCRGRDEEGRVVSERKDDGSFM